VTERTITVTVHPVIDDAMAAFSHVWTCAIVFCVDGIAAYKKACVTPSPSTMVMPTSVTVTERMLGMTP
jgi:hypothetical protein